MTVTIAKYSTLLLSLLFGTICFGQKEEKFPFNEFFVNVNSTFVADDNTENRMGFGIGAYHISRKEGVARLLAGIEFNQTRQNKKWLYDGRWSHDEDIDFTFYGVTIPAGMRIQVGNKAQFLCDFGGSFDIILSSRKQGTSHSNALSEDNTFEHHVNEFDDNSVGGLLFGFWGGIGVKIPGEKMDFILRTDIRSNVTKKSISDGLYPENIRFQYFRINLGIQI